MEDIIEKMAREIYVGRNGAWDYRAWNDHRTHEAYLNDARQALNASGLLEENAALKAQIKELRNGLERIRMLSVGFYDDNLTKINHLASAILTRE